MCRTRVPSLLSLKKPNGSRSEPSVRSGSLTFASLTEQPTDLVGDAVPPQSDREDAAQYRRRYHLENQGTERWVDIPDWEHVQRFRTKEAWVRRPSPNIFTEPGSVQQRAKIRPVDSEPFEISTTGVPYSYT